MRLDTLLLEILLKLINTFNYLIIRGVDLSHRVLLELVGLLVLELKSLSLSFFLDHHVLLPILDSFPQPLLHEPSVPLEFVDVGLAIVLLDSLELKVTFYFISCCSCLILATAASLSCLSLVSSNWDRCTSMSSSFWARVMFCNCRLKDL